MRLGRLFLVVATLITILVFPLVARDALQTVRLPNAYAQAQPGLDPAGTVMQNDDDDDNGDDDDGDDDNDNDDESDNEGEDNDNDDDDDACYLSLNSNEEVPCDFEDNDNFVADDNDNDGVVRQVVDRRSDESVNRPTKCFDTREVGVVQLGTGSYDVTVQVMPHSSFGQTTRMTLRSLNPSSVAAVTGGTLVDSVVYQLDAQAGCDGAAIGTLPNNVNMGIVYNVPNAVDKSKLQIVKLEGGTWTNVNTVPDPVAGNPYVSTTIMSAGTYALIQKP
jgi:hypothetical protein